MAIGKSNVSLKLNKLFLNFGSYKIIENGNLSKSYDEKEVANYEKWKYWYYSWFGYWNKRIHILYMDLTKKYIEINSDYRSQKFMETIKTKFKI